MAVNLLALGVFKYAGLFVSTLNQIPGLALPVPQIALPVGISFYTFQAMSYVVDVYRGQVGVQRSYLKFLLYISLFPQLIAGPIVRYSDIEAQLEERHASGEDMFYGLIRFSVDWARKSSSPTTAIPWPLRCWTAPLPRRPLWAPGWAF